MATRKKKRKKRARVNSRKTISRAKFVATMKREYHKGSMMESIPSFANRVFSKL